MTVLNHPDESELDDRFVQLFDEMVSASILIENTTIEQGINHAELERRVEAGFEELLAMRSMGWRFNQRRYTQMIIYRVGEIEVDDPEKDLSSIFLPYCHFMTIIAASEECDQLLAQFKAHGCKELLNLYVNRRTFRDLAEGFIYNAEELFKSKPDAIDEPTAKTVSAVALLFRIFLSPELAGHINFLTCDSVEEYQANHSEPPIENTQLQ